MMTQTNTWLGLGQTRGQGNSGRLRWWWWGWWGVSVWGLASSSRAVVIRSDSGAQSQQTLYHRHYLAQYIIHFMNICAMRNQITLFLSFLLHWGLTHYYLSGFSSDAELWPPVPRVITSVAPRQSEVNPHTCRTWPSPLSAHEIQTHSDTICWSEIWPRTILKSQLRSVYPRFSEPLLKQLLMQ